MKPPKPGKPKDILIICPTATFLPDTDSIEIYCLGTDISDEYKHLYQREFTATKDYGWKDLRPLQNDALKECSWITVTSGSGKFTRTVNTGSGRTGGEVTVAIFKVDGAGDKLQYEQAS
jgi:hypothetical protein